MGNIRILPDSVVSKIAAGEIVERPSSIVKELVENSIDAGSSCINIELEAGGKRLIRVSDDGSGMSRDDALLSLERHATSKLKNIDDLNAIRTLGFRGEALPSIAAVSRFSIITRPEGQIIGVRISVSGGVIKAVQETGCPHGTSVEARDIFFNTPARLKFMKTTDTELRNVLDVVQREALSHPNVRFDVSHNGKEIMSLPERGAIEDRLPDIFPKTALYMVHMQSDGVLIKGFMNGPDDARSTAQRLYTYVNSRAVKDRIVARMAIDSYGALLEKGKFPQGMLSIDLPYSEVDVNVHPTKSEVRFRRPMLIGDAIKAAIFEMLRAAPWMKGYEPPSESAPKRLWEGNQAYGAQAVETSRKSFHNRGAAKWPIPGEIPRIGSDHVSIHNGDVTTAVRSASQVALGDGGYFSSLRIVGQIGELYIICESENGMILIDQHAAHERLNYERLKSAASENGPAERQELLLPITLELSPYEASVLRDHLEKLERLGIKIEEFGKQSFVIRSIAPMLDAGDVEGLIRDILGEISSTEREQTVTEKLDKIIATIACHSSIRAGERLDEQQIMALLGRLDKADFPHSCPHGRPVAREMSFQELDRMFKRT